MQRLGWKSQDCWLGKCSSEYEIQAAPRTGLAQPCCLVPALLGMISSAVWCTLKAESCQASVNHPRIWGVWTYTSWFCVISFCCPLGFLSLCISCLLPFSPGMTLLPTPCAELMKLIILSFPKVPVSFMDTEERVHGFRGDTGLRNSITMHAVKTS